MQPFLSKDRDPWPLWPIKFHVGIFFFLTDSDAFSFNRYLWASLGTFNIWCPGRREEVGHQNINFFGWERGVTFD